MSTDPTDIDILSRRDALLAARVLTDDTAPRSPAWWSALSDPTPLRSYLTAISSLSEGVRADQRALLVASSAPNTRRAAAVHRDWVSRALDGFSEPTRPTAAALLTNGGSAAPGVPSPSPWLVHRCNRLFSHGSAHLVGRPLPDHPHIAHLCVVSPESLGRLVTATGVRALALATHDAPPRRRAALVGALEPEHRDVFARALLRAHEDDRAGLRVRLQAGLLRRSTYGTQMTVLIDAMAMEMLALAGGSRFAHDLAFVALRVPLRVGRTLVRASAAAMRIRDGALCHAARHVVDDLLLSLE